MGADQDGDFIAQNNENIAGAPQEKRDCEIVDFLSETIPDGTVIEPGQKFTKSWTFRNVGTCTWDTNYSMVFVEGERMESPSSVPLPGYVAPDGLVTVDIELNAPESEGEHKGRWQLRNEIDGKIYDVWVEIVVSKELNQ